MEWEKFHIEGISTSSYRTMLIAIDPQKFSVLYNSESKRNPLASVLYDLQGNSVIQKKEIDCISTYSGVCKKNQHYVD